MEESPAPVPDLLTSDGDGIRAFAGLIKDQLNPQDIKAILDSQRQILLKLDATNRNLANSNQKSSEIFNMSAQRNYQVLSGRLILMKQDLDLVFKKIRQLKAKLETKYPGQFSNATQEIQAARKQQQQDDEDDEEEEEQRPARPAKAAAVVQQQSSLTGEIPEPLKERSTSVTSTGSGSGVLLAGIMERARMGKDLVNGLIAGGKSSPAPVAPEPTDPAV